MRPSGALLRSLFCAAPLLIALLLALYPPAAATAADSWRAPDGSADSAKERFLLEGKIVSIEEIGSGVTKPRKVILAEGDKRMKAAFKTEDTHHAGVTTFNDGSKEVEFTDSYRYERAAYLLDRRLGLHLVPVTVLREINGETGALIEWVPDAVSEGQRRVLEGTTPEGLRRQQEFMEVFDALISNVDRHAGNELVTKDDKLHLIDHSRCFRIGHAVTKRFKALPIRVTPELLHNLESLQREELSTLLGDLLTRTQIRAILARRDRILKKLQRDREEYGDSFVIQPLDPDG